MTNMSFKSLNDYSNVLDGDFRSIALGVLAIMIPNGYRITQRPFNLEKGVYRTYSVIMRDVHCNQ
jgi:hypothetical protein